METKRWREDKNTRIKKGRKGFLDTRALQFHPLTRITMDQLDSVKIGKTPTYVKALC